MVPKQSKLTTHCSVNCLIFGSVFPSGGGRDGDEGWNYDPSEPRYCICNQVSYGDMVACDNVDVSCDLYM